NILNLYVVRCGRRLPTTTCPVGMEKLPTWLVEALVSMCTEIVTLRLQQVCRQALAAIAVIVDQSGTKARNRNTVGNRRSNYPTPAMLSCLNFIFEEIIQNQVLQCRIFIKGFFDFA